jgi:hypothetical protein
MLTLNKTKAALQSCQCHYEKLKQKQHTRPYAGGQSLAAYGYQLRVSLSDAQIRLSQS